jgi:hypothetical protein
MMAKRFLVFPFMEVFSPLDAYRIARMLGGSTLQSAAVGLSLVPHFYRAGIKRSLEYALPVIAGVYIGAREKRLQLMEKKRFINQKIRKHRRFSSRRFR